MIVHLSSLEYVIYLGEQDFVLFQGLDDKNLQQLNADLFRQKHQYPFVTQLNKLKSQIKSAAASDDFKSVIELSQKLQVPVLMTDIDNNIFFCI